MAHLKPRKMLLTALVVGLGLSGSINWTPTEGLIVVRQRGSQGWTALDSRQRGRRCASHHTARGGRGAAVGAAAVGTACVHRVLVNGVYVCR